MTPFYADSWLTVWGGDCREVLRTLPAESVHCVVTSPPYWGLRDYGTATWDGGDPDCDHQRQSAVSRASSGLGIKDGRGPYGDQYAATQGGAIAYGRSCGRCGATRVDGQLGLEATPEEYVATLVDVFREVRRVLRADGTLWLNLGDSYANDGKWGGETGGKQAYLDDNSRKRVGREKRVTGLKPKDLVGIPWLVAFALRADGWHLRSDIVWSKPNPMPESVTDRPTRAHEYVFLLTKRHRYYFDAEAVREGRPDSEIERSARGYRRIDANPSPGLPPGATPHTGLHRAASPDASMTSRNIRSVWTIATAPYPGAHFATFPPKLVEPCIKAGTSERGVCPECGAPWERVVGAPEPAEGRGSGNHERKVATNGERSRLNTHLGSSVPWQPTTTPTTGWRPTCRHEAEPVPATVLDPFAGTGTVGMVAQSFNRRAVLIDLNPEYLRQCLARAAREWLVGGPILEDRDTAAAPEDSLWAIE